MWNKFKEYFRSLIEESRTNQKALILSNLELEWAHIYHDSIKGIDFLQKLSLNVGRWAGNYTFFYILHRILNDYQPKTILEFGLGESTKMIDAYIKYRLKESEHLILEQSIEWEQAFKNRVLLSNNSNIAILPPIEKSVEGFQTLCYQNIDSVVNKSYNLYVVDGPHGSPRYSRFDIVYAASFLTTNDAFIIILDDYNRKGEQDTFQYLLRQFKANGISVIHTTYKGNKTVAVMASEHYKFITTL